MLIAVYLILSKNVLSRKNFETLPVLTVRQRREQLEVFAQLVSLQQYSRKQLLAQFSRPRKKNNKILYVLLRKFILLNKILNIFC